MFKQLKRRLSGIKDVKNAEHVDGDARDKLAPSEEEVVKNKYGGIVPKKPPLISKDHERAYFDSADWAFGKQGAGKPKEQLEKLRPKLSPTQQQTRYRKSQYAPSEDGTVPSEDAAAKE